jgi:hypothetical protein
VPSALQSIRDYTVAAFFGYLLALCVSLLIVVLLVNALEVVRQGTIRLEALQGTGSHPVFAAWLPAPFALALPIYLVGMSRFDPAPTRRERLRRCALSLVGLALVLSACGAFFLLSEWLGTSDELTTMSEAQCGEWWQCWG